MHKVTIYRRYAYQSPNHRLRWSFVLTIQHVNKHEIVFHNLHGPPGPTCTKLSASRPIRHIDYNRMDI